MTNRNLQENRDLLEKIFNKFDRYRSGLISFDDTVINVSQYLDSLGNVDNMGFSYLICSELLDICESSYSEDLSNFANAEINRIEYELRDYFKIPKHCCKKLDFDVIVDRTVIKYSAHSKTYRLLNRYREYLGYNPFFYCIYCGHKFSWKIHNKWREIVESKFGPYKEVGLFSGFGEDEWKKLPQKYQTDEWWKELLEYMDEEEIGDEEPQLPPVKPSMQGHCCSDMDTESTIKYEKHLRKYSLIYYHSKHRKYNQIHYCGSCGKELPKSLEKEWRDILEKEFGIKNDIEVGSSQWQQIPKEFKTDEWWKKRGL